MHKATVTGRMCNDLRSLTTSLTGTGAKEGADFVNTLHDVARTRCLKTFTQMLRHGVTTLSPADGKTCSDVLSVIQNVQLDWRTWEAIEIGLGLLPGPTPTGTEQLSPEVVDYVVKTRVNARVFLQVAIMPLDLPKYQFDAVAMRVLTEIGPWSYDPTSETIHSPDYGEILVTGTGGDKVIRYAR